MKRRECILYKHSEMHIHSEIFSVSNSFLNSENYMCNFSFINTVNLRDQHEKNQRRLKKNNVVH